MEKIRELIEEHSREPEVLISHYKEVSETDGVYYPNDMLFMDYAISMFAEYVTAHVDVLKHHVRERGIEDVGKYELNNIVIRGKMDCLKYLNDVMDLSGIWSPVVCKLAAQYGRLDMLEYLRELGCPWDEGVGHMACMFNHLDCLKFAHENGCKMDYDTILYAEKYGGECKKYLQENLLMTEEIMSDMLLACIRGDDLEVFKGICETCFNCGKVHLEEAAKLGKLNFIKYFVDNGYELDDRLIELSASNGHLDCVNFLFNNGCGLEIRMEGTTPMLVPVIKGGYLDVLKYLHEECWVPLTSKCCAVAAGEGKLKILKYLRENGCPWNKKTTEYALKHGHRDCYDYAVENGCPK
jgi:hypothetical protein